MNVKHFIYVITNSVESRTNECFFNKDQHFHTI